MDSANALDSLGRRIQMEYHEMPDLKLTLWQAGKLWNAPRELCEAALSSLVRSGYLCQSKDGRFLRRA
jgi:hypothetical protein